MPEMVPQSRGIYALRVVHTMMLLIMRLLSDVWLQRFQSQNDQLIDDDDWCFTATFMHMVG